VLIYLLIRYLAVKMRYSVLVLILIAVDANADDSTLDAAIGGGIGGAAGAAIGNELNGREGAIIGGALGGALGVAVNTDEKPAHSRPHGKTDYRSTPRQHPPARSSWITLLRAWPGKKGTLLIRVNPGV
jgi:hypothetical protein